VFVEDTAVVLDELAVVTRPGAQSRRGETASIAAALARERSRLHSLEAPATLDGGDVLRVGRTLYVGLSRRTNTAGLQQLSGFVLPFGYEVVGVPISRCLHLKSAVTLVAPQTVLLQPLWLDPAPFRALERIEVDPAETTAANVLALDDAVVCAASHPRTRERLQAHGLRTIALDVSEIEKAEGGLTCCSLVFERLTAPPDRVTVRGR
jgi:dimethylargininase